MWDQLVRVRARDMCEVCGKRRGLNCHHIIGRQNRRLRYDVRNGCLLCAKHHVLGTESAHKDPVWFYDWMQENRSGDWEYLSGARSEVVKRSAADLADLLVEMEKKL